MKRLGAAEAEKLTGIWNMSKYIYVVRTQIIRSLTYEFNVYGNIIMQTIIMITSAYFWRALYRNKEIVGGVDAESMLTYIIVSSVLSVLLITNVERRIEMSVQKGTIATDMMKPVNIFGVYFAEDAGNIAALVFQNMLPILLIGSLLIKVPVMADVRALPLFVLSAAESILINWLIAAIFGMMAFTAVNIDLRDDGIYGGQYRCADPGQKAPAQALVRKHHTGLVLPGACRRGT